MAPVNPKVKVNWWNAPQALYIVVMTLGTEVVIRWDTLGLSTELDPAVCSGDFGQVVLLKARRNLTDHEKFMLLTKHFVPPHSYKFPAHFVSGRNRHFQHSWLE